MKKLLFVGLALATALVSAPTAKATIFTGHYLVVEVAVYPTRGYRVTVSPSEMRLFINGAKYGLLPQSGSIVAGSLRWRQARRRRRYNGG